MARALLVCDSATSWYTFSYTLSWSNDCEVGYSAHPQDLGLTILDRETTIGHSPHIGRDLAIRCINIISCNQESNPVSSVRFVYYPMLNFPADQRSGCIFLSFSPSPPRYWTWAKPSPMTRALHSLSEREKSCSPCPLVFAFSSTGRTLMSLGRFYLQPLLKARGPTSSLLNPTMRFTAAAGLA